jgi:hypothetical protein
MSLLFADAKLISDFFDDIWVCKSLLKYSTYMYERGELLHNGGSRNAYFTERIWLLWAFSKINTIQNMTKNAENRWWHPFFLSQGRCQESQYQCTSTCTTHLLCYSNIVLWCSHSTITRYVAATIWGYSHTMHYKRFMIKIVWQV